MIKNRRILALEIAGTIFIVFLGTALHFTYALSGNNPFVGFLSAVNESVWEHLKLPFWPSLLWMLIEMYPLRKTVGNFFAAKATGAVIMVVLIPVVFYSYTAFTEEILAVDIATFMIAVIVGQIASVKLFKQGKQQSKSTEIIAIIVLALLAMLFIAFTFYPPHFLIFRDSNTGGYGARNVVRVVDDYPGYFPIYKQFGVPDRIGLLRSRRHSSQQYIDRGATRVVASWSQLQNDLPRTT